MGIDLGKLLLADKLTGSGLDKLNSKYEATSRAGQWLKERIEELRQQALDTELAVQKFRGEH
ncbi:hypothetical protein ACC848_45535, partial [Rhizobium johnstonii]